MTNKKQTKSDYDAISKKRLEIGERIRAARGYNHYTQQKVADELSKKLGSNLSKKDSVSVQSISYWECGTYLPSTENLVLLADVLGVSVSSLVEDRIPFDKAPQKIFYDIDRTYKRIESLASGSPKRFKNTIEALPFAKKAHEGCKLKNSDIPYISHPLTMAAHLLAMDIDDDVILAATLLHDVIEDCCVVDGQVMPTKIAEDKMLAYRLVDKDDLPVDDEVKELVSLMTHAKCDDQDKRDKMLKKYYAGLASNPKAALIKLVDRANNISKMSWGLSHERIHRMIDETDKYVLPLLQSIKNTKYDNAAYLLSYQMQTTLDIYKRLM